MSEGQKIRNQMIEAGAPSNQVDDWMASKRQEMLDAGAPLKEVNDYWGIREKEDLPGIPNVTAHIQASFDILKPENRPRYATNMAEALAAGWQSTAIGLQVRGRSPNLELAPEADWTQKGAAAIASVADLPGMIAGGIAGGALGAATGNPLGIAAGAGGGAALLPAAWRNILMDQYEHPGGARTWSEVAERSGKIILETGIDTAAGVAGGITGGVVGQQVAKRGGGAAAQAVSGIFASSITEVAAQSAMRMQVPGADDFIIATVMGLGMHTAGKVVSAGGKRTKVELSEKGEQFKQNLMQIYRDHGIPPQEAVRLMENDANLKSEMLAPRTADGQRVTPGLDAHKLRDPDVIEPYEPKIRAEAAPQVNVDAGLDTVVSLVSKLETGHIKDEAVRHTVVSPAGAIGYNQIMPDTAKQYGFDPARLGDKEYNLQASRVILADLSKRYDGDLEAILIGYNAGPGKANTFLRSGRDYRVLPKETRGYLANAERAGILDRGIIQAEVEKQLQGLRGDYTPPHQGRQMQGGDISWQSNRAYKDVWVVRQTSAGTTIPDPESVAGYMQEFGRLAGFKFAVSDRYWTDGPGRGEYGGADYQTYNRTREGGPAFSRYAQDEGSGNMNAPRQVWMPRADDTLMRRWFGLGNNEILYHEIGHAIDWFFNNSKVTGYVAPGSKLEAELLEASKNFRPFLWEKNPRYNGTPSELMADAFAAWLSNPEMRQRMPEFTRAYGERLKPFLEAANKALPTRKIKETVDEKTGAKGFKVEEGWNDPQWEMDAKERAKAQEGGGGGKPPAPPKRGLPGAPKEPPGKPPRIDLDPTMRLTEEELIAKLMDKIGEPGVRSGIPVEEPIGWFAKLRRTMEDQFGGALQGPARRVEEKLGLAAHTLDDLFRMTYASSNFAQFFLTNGVIEPVSRRKVSDASWSKALKQIGEDGGTTEGFYAYMMYSRALDLMHRGIDVGIDLGHATQYLKMKGIDAKYARGVETLRESKNGLINYGKKSHLFTEQAAVAMKLLGEHHIVLKRIIDPSYMPPTPDTKLGVRQKPNRIKGGSDKDFVDVPTAEFDNFHTIIAMSDRNVAINNLALAVEDWISRQPKQIRDARNDVWVVERLPDDIMKLKKTDGELQDAFGRPLSKETEAAWAPFIALRNAYRGMHVGRDDLIFFREGKPMVMRIKDPDIAKLVKVQMDGPDSKAFPMRMMQEFARLERAGITLEPTFAFRSWTIGQLAAAVQAEGGSRMPFKGFLSAAMDVYNLGPKWEMYVRNGGLGASMQDIDKMYGEYGIDKLPRKGNGLWNVFTDLQAAKEALRQLNPIENLRKFSNFMDTAARVAFMDNDMKKYGTTEFQAAMKARRAHFDYAEPMAQAWLQNLTKYAPFVSTNLKDMGQFYSGIADRPGQIAMYGAAIYTAPTLLNYAINAFLDSGKKEDDPTRYHNLPQYMRDSYWVLPAVNGTRIKIPRGIGAMQVYFGTSVERALDAMFRNDPKGLKDWAMKVIEVQLGGFMPTLAQPFLDHARNKTELGQPLITQDLEGASGHMQYGPNTTETAKALSRLIGEPTMGKLGVDVSPIVIENYIRQWGGTMPLKALQYLESKLVEDTRPWSPADNPLVGWFFVRNPVGGQKVNDFYEGLKKFEQARKDLQLAKRRRNLDEMQQVNLAIAAFRLEGLKRAIGKQRAEIKAIYETKTVEEGQTTERGPGLAMTLDEKRKFIDGLSQQMVTSATMGLQQMREFDKILTDQAIKGATEFGGSKRQSRNPLNDLLGTPPPALRAFVTTMAGDKTQITEAFFTPEEREVLRDTAEKSLSKGERTIGYGGYGEKDPWSTGTKGALDALTDLRKSLAFTLGMASVRKEPDGTIVIRDRYDWNAKPEVVERVKQSRWETLKMLGQGFVQNGLLGFGNVLGNLAVGGAGGGRDVEIRIPPKVDKSNPAQ